MMHHTWEHNVDERIELIIKGLRSHHTVQEHLPGLKQLLDDYLDPRQAVGTDDDQQGFHRRLLQVFRDSRADFTYEDWLKKLKEDEQRRVEDFVDGKNCQDVCKNFKFDRSLGVREELEFMAKTSPVIVNGLSNDDDEDEDGDGDGDGAERPSIFRKLSCGFDVLFERSKRDSVVVSQVAPGLRVKECSHRTIRCTKT